MIRREQQHLGAIAKAVDVEVEGEALALGLGRVHQQGVAPVHVGGEAQPIARILPFDEGAHRVRGPVGQRVCERLLGGGDTLAATAGIGARQHGVGLMIKRA